MGQNAPTRGLHCRHHHKHHRNRTQQAAQSYLVRERTNLAVRTRASPATHSLAVTARRTTRSGAALARQGTRRGGTRCCKFLRMTRVFGLLSTGRFLRSMGGTAPHRNGTSPVPETHRRPKSAKHVAKRRRADPNRNLSTDTSQHHAHRVKPTCVKQPLHINIWTNERLVIWSECLWSADSGFNPNVFNCGTSRKMTFEIVRKGVPIKVEQSERKIWIGLLPELGIRLVAAQSQRISLRLEIDAQVVITHVGQTWVNALDAFSHDIGVLHGSKGKMHSAHLCHRI
mmetsp:Transcript_53679/g.122959  ORF Transcript_53679/g.122959 Transcript_53679/m.122959 type:complete len:285 (+) Transcript_53679:1326-2180(+)